MTDRVLIVDDYERWRYQVVALLQANPRWQVVGEARDGLEAVQLAATLRPDLILLDVGLPSMNGLEVARQLRAQSLDCRILFLSEQASWDIVEAALGAGGHGYVLKSDARRELIEAMEAVAAGMPFVSARLKSTAPAALRHEVGFYSDDTFLLEEFVRFAEARLKVGQVLFVVSAEGRRPRLEQELERRGLDVERLVREGRYRWIDVTDALASVLVDGWPDDARFAKFMAGLIEGVPSGADRPRLAAWGECAPTLWRSGETDAAIRLEQMWDAAARAHGIDILCAYSLDGPRFDKDNPAHQSLRALHSSVHSR